METEVDAPHVASINDISADTLLASDPTVPPANFSNVFHEDDNIMHQQKQKDEVWRESGDVQRSLLELRYEVLDNNSQGIYLTQCQDYDGAEKVLVDAFNKIVQVEKNLNAFISKRDPSKNIWRANNGAVAMANASITQDMNKHDDDDVTANANYVNDNYAVEIQLLDQLKSTTLTNVSFVVYHKGMFREALAHLESSQELDAKYGVQSPVSFINLCVVLNAIGNYSLATQHALQAIDILRRTAEPIVSAQPNRCGITPQQSDEKLKLWGAAWHNLAISQLQLADPTDKLENSNIVLMFENSMAAVNELLGYNHPMSRSVTETYRIVRRELKSRGAYVPHFLSRTTSDSRINKLHTFFSRDAFAANLGGSGSTASRCLSANTGRVLNPPTIKGLARIEDKQMSVVLRSKENIKYVEKIDTEPYVVPLGDPLVSCKIPPTSSRELAVYQQGVEEAKRLAERRQLFQEYQKTTRHLTRGEPARATIMAYGNAKIPRPPSRQHRTGGSARPRRVVNAQDTKQIKGVSSEKPLKGSLEMAGILYSDPHPLTQMMSPRGELSKDQSLQTGGGYINKIIAGRCSRYRCPANMDRRGSGWLPPIQARGRTAIQTQQSQHNTNSPRGAREVGQEGDGIGYTLSPKIPANYNSNTISPRSRVSELLMGDMWVEAPVMHPRNSPSTGKNYFKHSHAAQGHYCSYLASREYTQAMYSLDPADRVIEPTHYSHPDSGLRIPSRDLNYNCEETTTFNEIDVTVTPPGNNPPIEITSKVPPIIDTNIRGSNRSNGDVYERNKNSMDSPYNGSGIDRDSGGEEAICDRAAARILLQSKDKIAERLRMAVSESQFAPFDYIIVLPNTRFPVTISQARHLAAMSSLCAHATNRLDREEAAKKAAKKKKNYNSNQDQSSIYLPCEDLGDAEEYDEFSDLIPKRTGDTSKGKQNGHGNKSGNQKENNEEMQKVKGPSSDSNLIEPIPKVHMDLHALEHPDERMPILRKLVARFPNACIVHWLPSVYDMAHWGGITNMLEKVPFLLLRPVGFHFCSKRMAHFEDGYCAAKHYSGSWKPTAGAPSPCKREKTYCDDFKYCNKEKSSDSNSTTTNQKAEEKEGALGSGQDSYRPGISHRYVGLDTSKLPKAYQTSGGQNIPPRDKRGSDIKWSNLISSISTSTSKSGLLQSTTNGNPSMLQPHFLEVMEVDRISGVCVRQILWDRGDSTATTTSDRSGSPNFAKKTFDKLNKNDRSEEKEEQEKGAEEERNNVGTVVIKKYSDGNVDGESPQTVIMSAADQEQYNYLLNDSNDETIGTREGAIDSDGSRCIQPSVLRYINSHGLYRDFRKGSFADNFIDIRDHSPTSEGGILPSQSGIGGMGMPQPPHNNSPRGQTPAFHSIAAIPSIIPKLELHYDAGNVLALRLYDWLREFECREGQEPDLIVPIGGDGYMMHCIRSNWNRFIPFFGVNAGNVGFLLNDSTTLDELFSAPIKLHNMNMLYCWAQTEEPVDPAAPQGPQTCKVREELAFNDAWVERASGQSALVRIIINGVEKIRRVRGDGVLVSTAAGSTAYAQALGASPFPVGVPLIQLVGSNVVSPPRWKPVHLNQEDTVEFEIIDTQKRPCRGFVDSVDIGIVKRVQIKTSRVASVQLAFCYSCDLKHKLYQLQFPEGF